MHIDIARPRWGQVRLRATRGALAADSHRHDNHDECHLNARRSQRRISGQHRCCGMFYAVDNSNTSRRDIHRTHSQIKMANKFDWRFLHYSSKNWYSPIKSTEYIIMKAFKNGERCCLCLQKEWRSNRADFRRKVARCVRRSQEDVWYSCSAHTCSTPSSPLTDQ